MLAFARQLARGLYSLRTVVPCACLPPDYRAAMSLPLTERSSNVPQPARRATASKRHAAQLESRDSPTRKLTRAALQTVTASAAQSAAAAASAVTDTSISASSLARSHDAKTARVLPPSPAPPAWCSCGNCAVEDVDSKGAAPVCCLDVATGRSIIDDSEGVCDSEEVAVLLRDGVCYGDFLRFTPRVFTRLPRPSSWAECNNAQKRLMLYAALHESIYRGGRKGQRDAMPECIKHRVRTAYPRDS